MIQIIKPGVIKHNLTCPKCDCEFLYTADEVTEETVCDDHGGYYPVASFFYITCPFSNLITYIDERKFTEEELSITKKVTN